MKTANTIIVAALVAIVASYATVKMTGTGRSGGSGVNKESAYDRVMNSGTIRCGYGISPPALVKDVNTGKLSGLDYDIWEAIGRQLGVKIEWAEEAGWGNFIEGLRTKRYDAFCSGMWVDPSRAKFLTTTLPVIYSTLDAYTRIDDHRFDNSLESIDSPTATLPGIDGDISTFLAQSRFPNAKILTLPQANTLSDMLLSVKTKKADVIFLNEAMYSTFEKDNKGVLRKVETLPPAFISPSYYGFNKGEYALRDMVNIALRSMIDDGRLEKMARQYSKDYIPANKNYTRK